MRTLRRDTYASILIILVEKCSLSLSSKSYLKIMLKPAYFHLIVIWTKYLQEPMQEEMGEM